MSLRHALAITLTMLVLRPATGQALRADAQGILALAGESCSPASLRKLKAEDLQGLTFKSLLIRGASATDESAELLARRLAPQLRNARSLDISASPMTLKGVTRLWRAMPMLTRLGLARLPGATGMIDGPLPRPFRVSITAMPVSSILSFLAGQGRPKSLRLHDVRLTPGDLKSILQIKRLRTLRGSEWTLAPGNYQLGLEAPSNIDWLSLDVPSPDRGALRQLLASSRHRLASLHLKASTRDGAAVLRKLPWDELAALRWLVLVCEGVEPRFPNEALDARQTQTLFIEGPWKLVGGGPAHPNITSLRLKGLRLRQVAGPSDMLQRLSAVRSLSVERCDLGPTAAELLLTSKALRYLEIEDCKLTSAKALDILRAMAKRPHKTSLRLAGKTVTREDAAWLIEAARGLRGASLHVDLER